jgi:hypothetical protein
MRAVLLAVATAFVPPAVNGPVRYPPTAPAIPALGRPVALSAPSPVYYKAPAPAPMLPSVLPLIAVVAAGAVAGAAATKLVGTKVPSVELHTGFGLPDDTNRINLAERCKGKKVIVMGLPGAFTPT